MQTTLRLNDDIYHRAKARAVERGMTLTRFIEEALVNRLLQPEARVLPPLPVHDSGVLVPEDFSLLAAVAEEAARYHMKEAGKAMSPDGPP